MIVDLLVQGLLVVVTGLTGLFPGYSLGGSFTSFGSTLGASLAGLNGVIPVTTIGLCLVTVIAARLFLLGVAVVQWLYGLIPFN